MITMYGIPNCDTIKKAKKWLEAENIAFEFHDYRKNGISAELVAQFCKQFGWETVLNKRGTTYRQLTDDQKASLNEETAIPLLVEHPAMIKRPILVTNDKSLIGFKAAEYAELFK
ncbi:MAG: ArsC family reductase [Vibrio sp.]